MLVTFAALCHLSGAKAANVNPGSGYTNAFASQPAAADWSTRAFGTTSGQTGAGEITTAAAMDAAIQTNTAAMISGQCASATGTPPSGTAQAVWSSAGAYLQTRPSQTAVGLLMGTFTNSTGTNATGVRIRYDYTTNRAASVAEEVRGHRVFYSLSGAVNSWSNIVELTQTAQGTLSVDLTLSGPWSNGGRLYLLWADDNGSGSPDDPNNIDNFFINVLGGASLPGSCVLTSPTNGQANVSSANVTLAATATPDAGTTNAGVGFYEVAQGLLGSALNAPFTTSVNLAAGDYQIYAVATNSLGAFVFSGTNALRVADPISIALTEPANGSGFDQAVSVSATSTVAGGTAPYTVRFFTNNVLMGVADGNSGAAFYKNLGNFFVGNHTVRSSVTDSKGWVSNSAVSTITVTGPLFASLTPATASFNYGTSVTLTGTVVGGTAPYSVVFYTNGQPAGSAGPGASPFTVALGLLPVGTYASHVAAVDNVAATTNSATNVITILANPLLTTLLGPTNGQDISSGQGFAILATVTVGSPITVSNTEFFLDGVSLGTDSTAPFSNFVASASLGTHSVYAAGADSLGRKSFSATNQFDIVPTGILVGPDGYTNSFASPPVAADWATVSSSGAGTATYNLTNAVQATAPAGITSPVVDGSPDDPPDGNALAFWTSGDTGYLGTRPTGNRFTALLATMLNNTGTNATNARITYDLGIKSPQTEPDYPGFRAFYSLSAQSNAWVAIPELSSSAPAAGTLTANLSFATPWNQGAYLYLLWIDDNANITPAGTTDPAYTLDNFFAGVTAGSAVVPPVSVTLTAPTNNAVFLAPPSIALEAAASASNGTVAKVEFFADSVKLGEVTNAPYSFAWTNPPPGPHALHAVATDEQGASALSSLVDIFVFDSVGSPVVSISDPVDGSVVEGPIDLSVTALTHSLNPITNVQFFTNGVVIGNDSTEPYGVVWSAAFGTNALMVVAYDATGKQGTSAVVSVVVEVPPTNTVAPTVDTETPGDGATVTSLTSINVLFTERVQNVNAGDLLVNSMPATGLTGSGSNYTFTFTQPADGVVDVRFASGHGITDFGFPAVLPFDENGPSASWSYSLIDGQVLAITRGPYLQSGSPTGAVVRWRTDVFSDAAVRYGTNPASLGALAVQTISTNNHVVQITGLQPDTKYFYSVGTPGQTLAGGTNFWFKTSPLPGVPKPTRFWVLGDSGTANANARAVRDAYYNFATTNNHAADLWLMLGDNAYNSGTDSEYQSAVFDMYPATLRNLFLWPVLGNHETSQSTTATQFPYLDIFSTPQNGAAGGLASGNAKYYSFDYANIHFVALDSMTSGRTTNSVMAQWLQDDLAASLQEWTVVYFHHPPYTKGSHNSDSESDLVQIRQNLVPILEAYGVDLVLSGHSHAYERSYLLNGHYGLSGTLTEAMKIDGGDGIVNSDGAYQKNASGQGTVYGVAGSSGQISGGNLNHPAHFVSLNQLGSMIIDVNSNRLDARFITSAGEINDHFTLLKRAVVPPAAPVNLVAGAGTNAISLAWPDTATNETGFVIERSLDGTNFVQVLSVGANVTNALDSGLSPSTTYFYRVRAMTGSTPSEFSNLASATTIAPLTPPATPTDLVASADNGLEFYRSRIFLRWRDRSTNEAGFLVERSTNGSAFTQISTVGANIVHYLDQGLNSASLYYYRVSSFNGAGSALSETASARTHPQSDLVFAGGTAVFHGGAEGTPPVRYQWLFEGVPIAGATNETLTLQNVTPGSEGSYSVAITNAPGQLVSNPAYLFVLSPPFVVMQPISRTNLVGSTAIFTVGAAGDEPLTYQWRRNSVPIPGAASTTFTIASVQLIDQAGYDVLVENDFGSVTSDMASLTVLASVSAPHIDSIQTASENKVRVIFHAAANQSYTLLFAPTLGESWTAATNYPAVTTNRVIQFLAPQSGAGGFYRLASP